MSSVLVLQKASGEMATGSTDRGPSALPQLPCVFPCPRGICRSAPINPRYEGGARWPDPQPWQGRIQAHRMLVAPSRQRRRRWGTASTPGIFSIV